MFTAPVGLDEDARIAALADYEISAKSADPAFAELCRLATRLFNVPTAFVSIVERDRQVFFAKVGIKACETGRDIAFCSHTIVKDDCLVVLDARLDPRFHDNPLVTGDPFIRFYAGNPLRAPSGHVIGSMCLVDTKPRNRFSARDRASLSDVAKLVGDLLEARRLEIARRVSHSRFESIAATSPDGIVCADHKGTITVWNDATTRLFGHDAATAIGQSIDLIVPVEMRGWHGSGMQRVVRGEAPRLIGKTIDLQARHKDGTEFPIELSLSMWQEDGSTAFGAIIRDLRERRGTEEQLFRLAHFDPLTGLPNRTVLRERIGEAIHLGQPVTVLLIDLDHFKDVANTLGREAGEKLLRTTAHSLVACVGPNDIVARLGDDDFAVMISGCADSLMAGRLAERINERVAEPQTIEGQKVALSASIGIAVSHCAGTADDLISCADLALLQAKTQGHCYRLFEPELKQTAIHKRTNRDDLHRAAEQCEFELFYQPQVSLHNGALVGAEALIRWRHPEKGLLTPAAFLTALESSRYAGEVGDWILQEACRQARLWRNAVPAFRMGVNLFAAQCRSGNLVRNVFDALETAQLAVSGLEIEITENIILQHDERQISMFQTLHQAGVGIAFDDYGTGYASLSQLKVFPLSRLKIDQSFVRGICENHQDAAIVRAVISLSRSFNLNVIAEGVETPEQQRRLLAKGCNEAQGYLFAKPLSAQEFNAQYGLSDVTQYSEQAA